MTPLEELQARLDELQIDAEFVIRANEFRLRGDAFTAKNVGAYQAGIAKRVTEFRYSGPEGIYAAILVKGAAAFERYLRLMLSEAIDKIRAKYSSPKDLPETIRNRNLVLTGKALSRFYEPPDHLILDTDRFVTNLALIIQGDNKYQLNSYAYSLEVSGAKSDQVEHALKQVSKKYKEKWNLVCEDADLAAYLNTGSAVATAKEARDKLDSACRSRNSIAHGGDGEPEIGKDLLLETIGFLKVLAGSVQKAMNRLITELED